MKTGEKQRIELLLFAKSEMHFFNLLHEIVKRIGFEYYAFGIRFPWPVTSPRLLFHHVCPAVWQWPATNATASSVKNTAGRTYYSGESLAWSVDLPSNRLSLWKDFRQHGLRAGWDQPYHGPMGISSMLSLATATPGANVEDVDELSPYITWLTHTAHHGLANLFVPKYLPEARIDFSDREIDILRLTADGKTAGTTSRIMHISERTVNFHMEKILQKLAVANKTTAVLKAAMLGLL